MKIIGLALLLAARGAAAAEMSGSQLLQKSAASYAALRSYAGSARVRSEVQVGRTKIAQTATAVIRFQRPGRIRIEGKDVTGRPYRIISDGRATWSAPTSRTNPAAQQMANVQMAIIGMTGIAAGAPATLPAMLLNLRWGNPFLHREGSRRLPDERIDGRDCYKVVHTDANTTRSYWIDRRTFLLRQMQEAQDARQLAAFGRGAAVTSRVVRYSFIIEQVNGPMPAKLFQRP